MAIRLRICNTSCTSASSACSLRDSPRLSRLRGTSGGGQQEKMGMIRKLTSTIIVLALFVTFIALGVLALFTDTASVPGNTFSTGTVDISTSPTSALVTFSNMAPGDAVVNPVTVSNGGSHA